MTVYQLTWLGYYSLAVIGTIIISFILALLTEEKTES